jgi:hypothetical protein
MQKAMDRLNIRSVVSDILGWSGMRIIKAILGGKEIRRTRPIGDEQILKTKRAPMLEALRGIWRKEHLFALELAVDSYESYQKQMPGAMISREAVKK